MSTAESAQAETDKRTAESMRKEAEKWTRTDLLRLWADVKEHKEVPNWNVGKAFEYLVIQAFRLETPRARWPFHVTYPQKFGMMEQLDGIVFLGERAFLIESKQLSQPAAIEAVAKLRFRLESRPPGTMGVLFSVDGFSTQTEIFAQFAVPMNVLLWDRTDLDIALEKGAMVATLEQKLEYAIEEGLPLYRPEGAA